MELLNITPGDAKHLPAYSRKGKPVERPRVTLSGVWSSG
jgi:hypothetical protein